MKKIYTEKEEGVAEIVEKIIGSADDTVTLIIPKNSSLAASVSNFHLIKREADSVGKKVLIESVDDGVLALAKSSGLEAVHPLLDARRGSALSDIVPLRGSAHEEKKIKQTPATRKRGREAVREEEQAEPRSYNFKSAIHYEEEAAPKIKAERAAVENSGPGETGARERESGVSPLRKRLNLNLRFIILVVAVIAAAATVVFVTGAFFNKATVEINFQKIPWSYEHTFVADSSVAKVNADGNSLPAELFTPQTNIVQAFAASGFSTISQKAAGKITIYNAYSSAPQTLVASTRFATADGKIFRITDKVVVPGAIVKGGQITPSSIGANIAADKAGSDYNVGSIVKLTIPGFKGTARYNGFYGEIKTGTSGGFIGRSSVPTPSDISAAKSKVADILTTRLNSGFLSGFPEDFTILPGASSTNITKLTADSAANASGTFNVFGEASMNAVGFRESDLKLALAALANEKNPGMVFASLDLTYSNVRADLTKGSESFYVAAKGVLQPDFSAGDLVVKIAGKSVDAARAAISSLPYLTSAKVYLWPIWLKTLPTDAKKIKIIAN